MSGVQCPHCGCHQLQNCDCPQEHPSKDCIIPGCCYNRVPKPVFPPSCVKSPEQHQLEEIRAQQPYPPLTVPTDELETIRLLALAATRGDWSIGIAGRPGVVAYDGDDIVFVCNGEERNQRYFVAVQPKVILRLLERLVAAEAALTDG